MFTTGTPKVKYSSSGRRNVQVMPPFHELDKVNVPNVKFKNIKPLRQMAKFLWQFTDEKDYVFDLFGGSATSKFSKFYLFTNCLVSLACSLLNRNCVYVENDPDRYKAFTQKQQILKCTSVKDLMALKKSIEYDPKKDRSVFKEIVEIESDVEEVSESEEEQEDPAEKEKRKREKAEKIKKRKREQYEKVSKLLDIEAEQEEANDDDSVVEESDEDSFVVSDSAPIENASESESEKDSSLHSATEEMGNVEISEKESDISSLSEPPEKSPVIPTAAEVPENVPALSLPESTESAPVESAPVEVESAPAVPQSVVTESSPTGRESSSSSPAKPSRAGGKKKTSFMGRILKK